MRRHRGTFAVMLTCLLVLGVPGLLAPAGAAEKEKVSVGVALPPHAAGHHGPQKLDLAFCSQLLCVIPFEVARAKGFFAEEGLDVQLIYMKGGPPAVVALQAKSVDFIGTTMDLAVKSTAGGKRIVMVASTARLPFFALAVAPEEAGRITGPEHLVGKWRTRRRRPAGSPAWSTWSGRRSAWGTWERRTTCWSSSFSGKAGSIPRRSPSCRWAPTSSRPS
ncbi:MAG: ABC transporter substrate-binding protein [candidate division NC10 bacterium]|nr:ABC transporter substrate-binding protein [candidate division NC10 bacterium]